MFWPYPIFTGFEENNENSKTRSTQLPTYPSMILWLQRFSCRFSHRNRCVDQRPWWTAAVTDGLWWPPSFNHRLLPGHNPRERWDLYPLCTQKCWLGLGKTTVYLSISTWSDLLRLLFFVEKSVEPLSWPWPSWIYIYILGKVFGARDWLIENPKNSRTYEGQELPSTWNNHLLNLFGTQTADRRIGRILLTGLFEAGSYVQLPCCQPWHFRISIITLKPKVHDLSTLKWRSDKVCSSFGQPQFIHFVWRRNGLRARCCDCVSYYC